MLIAPAEKPASQRIVGNHPQTLIATQRQQLAFDFPVEEIVTRLDGVEARPALKGARAQRQGHLPGRIIRAAQVADLAVADQVVQGPQGFLQGSFGIGTVRLIEVNVAGAQPAQTVLDRLQDVPSRQALVIGLVSDAHAALGRQHEALAFAFEPFADNQFGTPGGLR